MSRLMIIPAAGPGSRLQSSTPKMLFPVAGRPMIDYILDSYAPVVERFIVVLHPSFAEAAERHCAESGLQIEYAIQPEPTGMLDAILLAQDRVRRHQPKQVWITWCDQVAVHPKTINRLAETADRERNSAIVMPTVIRQEPYIHLVRNACGEISGLLHRREGDHLPEVGEADLGLFCLSQRAYLELLPRFASEAIRGQATRERNFLPFIPWLAGKASVVTFPAEDSIESIGVNDSTDLRHVEKYLIHARKEAFSNYSRLQ